jgi:pyridine nucleotide-disulfide oxidoreductase family protein
VSAPRTLLLLGGGHAHVQVLQALAHAPMAGVRPVLVTPYARQIYSGMVPGLLAGHYRAAQCVIPLEPLAAAARAELHLARAVELDAAQRQVTLDDGRRLGYDLLSIDTGPETDLDALPGARAHALPVRPIEEFVQRLDACFGAVAPALPSLVVVGGGAAGVELAMALAWRQRRTGAVPRVALVPGPTPLAGLGAGTQRRAWRALAAQGVAVAGAPAAAVDADRVVLTDGTQLPCDAAVLALGAAAPRWLAGSGLALDARGFIATGPTLQSVSHGDVFAAGDVASRVDAPHPKSGVYAVRAGPPLAANLRARLQGGPLRPYRPQRRTLYLLSCGERRAIAAWGSLGAEGVWVWRWKDRIDRAFIARYASAATAPA